MEKATPPKEFVVIVQDLPDRPARQREVTVEELFDTPGSSEIEEYKRTVTSGRLRLLREDDETREFDANVVGEGFISKMKIYQPRGGSVIAIGCPTYARDIVAGLISLCIYGSPRGFRSLRFEREEFERIWNYASKLGGKLREIHLRRISKDRVSIYHVTGTDILGVKEIGNPLELMKTAKKIKRLGFSFPPNVISDSPFHFWVADWGGGTLYEPLNPLPHHALALAEFFRKALEG